MALNKTMALNEKYLYGYAVDVESVWFEAKWEDSQTGIDDRTGQRVRIDYQSFHRLAIAGDFNGWTLQYMAQNATVFSDWRWSALKSNFPVGKSQFKFVYDDHIWIDPPASASNTVKSDIGYDSYNLEIEIVKPKKRTTG